MGELIFCQPDLFDGQTLFYWYLNFPDSTDLAEALRARKPRGPYVSGAYIIKAETGMDKLSGVCYCIDKFNKESAWRTAAEDMLYPTTNYRLETAWEWLKKQYYLGPFTAYEIVCDLRYTELLEKAPDRLTWANPGPGAIRGLNRVCGVDPNMTIKRSDAIAMMAVLLSESTYRGWTDWEMREVEHTLCEFDKYERVRLGQGRSKRRYRCPGQ